ncbi:response regulator [Haloprofundus sp. MHR1]|uniref:response regulator n=1 Tax=Haloprofundus sp. MHR1 TaxID=2572921 RepID=UPI0010BE556C|nr:HalX domain-containing protein [Haloprofundus sp. MHR1]QCJ48027.1 response regulator [Haloprofundus sp. MHR1]
MDHTVLVVDDDPDIAHGHAERLRDRYRVLTATSGAEALELADDADAVLLDRRMPGMSGDEVLSALHERENPPQVAMVTAVDPTTDVAEMPFDEYLVKPVRRDDLFAVVESLLVRATYDSQLQEFFAVASKVALLETEHSARQLESDSNYELLKRRLATLRRQTTDQLEELGSESYAVAIGPGDAS